VTITAPEFRPGTLVHARGRDWLVLPGPVAGALIARPLGGADDETTALLPALEEIRPASFEPPTVDDRGDAARARLLRDALRLSFRATAGPFRSFASLTVSPRNYQLVPLMMSAAQDTTRLLIADGVGVGKTVEAGLIIAELLATGDAERLAVLCSPQLAPQWRAELRSKFGIQAELLLPSTAARLDRQVPTGSTIYQHFPHLIVSTDYIKQRNRRDEFAIHCPDLVVVDEAHTSIAPTSVSGKSQAHLRYALLRRLADDPNRHLLLLTATPHNGDDGAWQSLVGLLDERLGRLPADLSGSARDADRQLLAKYLIQRQRADIREYLEEDTPFAERHYAEESYRLTPEYRRLLDRVLAYARETVDDASLSKTRQRVQWWSAIALLRCLASSPASAEQTLLNRSDLAVADSPEEADELAGPRVFDVDMDEATEGEDTVLGVVADDAPETAEQGNRRRLRQFANEAAALKGPSGDAKLKRAIAMVKKLLDEGYHPILFCRYIPTADYVAEHLAHALRRTDARVEAVTGTLPPEDREDRVKALTGHDGPRVLIATDCLSEGVNLQEGFTAVIHYDLAWNPTRHEQREGRVDRFGQTAKTVRAVTYYGEDNRIDGVVLDVLIRRHAAIKRSTGVSVPVPVDSATVMNAVWESLLLRGTEPDQLMLDFGSTTSSATADAVLVEWQNAAEREKASRSRFRQAMLHPEQVAHTLAEVRAALGGPADARSFVGDALSLLGGQTRPTDDGFTALVDTLPQSLRDQLPAMSSAGTVRFRDSLPAPRGDALLVRTDPTVEAIARYTLDAALDPLLPDEARPARRAGAMRTAAVREHTTLLVVRYRVELTVPGNRTTVTQIAEDAQFLAYTLDDDDRPVWIDRHGVDALLDAVPSGSIADELARDQLAEQIGSLPSLQAHLDRVGGELSEATSAAHRRVRPNRPGRRAVAARLLPPADVLGVFVYLPDRSVL
jgi:superfamily II DNA or RNA helicase